MKTTMAEATNQLPTWKQLVRMGFSEAGAADTIRVHMRFPFQLRQVARVGLVETASLNWDMWRRKKDLQYAIVLKEADRLDTFKFWIKQNISHMREFRRSQPFPF